MIQEELERISHVTVGANPKTQELLKQHKSVPLNTGSSLSELIRRPELNYDLLRDLDPQRPELPDAVIEQVNINIKYDGYIKRQIKQVESFKKLENKKLEKDFDYEAVSGLSQTKIKTVPSGIYRAGISYIRSVAGRYFRFAGISGAVLS